MKNIKLYMFLLIFTALQSFVTAAQVELAPHNTQVQILKPKMQLFYYNQCPYCIKVAQFLNGQPTILDAVDIQSLDASIPENLDLLRSLSGKTQVPYLVDADAHVQMAESDDIIAYFIKKFNITYAPVVSVNQQSKDESSQKAYDPATFITDIAQRTKPVVLLVSTTWCPPCKIFKPIFLQVAQEQADVADFICVDGDANQGILDQLGVRGFPSVVCYKNGKKIHPQNYRSKEALVAMILKLTAN